MQEILKGGTSLKLELKPSHITETNLYYDVSTGFPRAFVPQAYRQKILQTSSWTVISRYSRNGKTGIIQICMAQHEQRHYVLDTAMHILPTGESAKTYTVTT